MNETTSSDSIQIKHSRLRVRVEQDRGQEYEECFPELSCVSIGRSEHCDVRVDSGYVSRCHAEIAYKEGRWYVSDLESTNGTYLNGEPIQGLAQVTLEEESTLQLTQEGPILHLSIEEVTTRPMSNLSVSQVVQDLLTRKHTRAEAGTQTAFLHDLVAYVQGRQKRKYRRIIVAGVSLVVILAVFGLYQYNDNRKLRNLADELVAERKAIDVEIAQITQTLEVNGQSLDEQLAQLQEWRRQRQQMAFRYEAYIKELGIRRRATPQEQLIYRVAYLFNESESDIPATFIREVQAGIRYWQNTGKGSYQRAISRAQANGYVQDIVTVMQDYGLPPQFFYLALQESMFDVRAVGPSTNYGFAKGMWQFIPGTAVRYDLDIGQLWMLNQFAQDDERFDFEKSTDAAARYLLHIYGTLAQASGLLVMASYNWGENRITDRLERLPEEIPETAFRAALADVPTDPRSRSYWRFYGRYNRLMPEETKDYVVKIFAAAVIGENPRLFGFDFDNPLQPYIETSGL